MTVRFPSSPAIWFNGLGLFTLLATGPKAVTNYHQLTLQRRCSRRKPWMLCQTLRKYNLWVFPRLGLWADFQVINILFDRFLKIHLVGVCGGYIPLWYLRGVCTFEVLLVIHLKRCMGGLKWEAAWKSFGTFRCIKVGFWSKSLPAGCFKSLGFYPGKASLLESEVYTNEWGSVQIT